MSWLFFSNIINSGTRAFQIQDVFSLENEDSDETTTLIDKKVGQMSIPPPPPLSHD